VLCGQTLATFGAATVYYQTPSSGGHSRTKTVGALAFQDAGLKCSFHVVVPDIQGKREPPNAYRTPRVMCSGQKKGWLFYVNVPPNSINTPVFFCATSTAPVRRCRRIYFADTAIRKKAIVTGSYIVRTHFLKKISTTYPQRFLNCLDAGKKRPATP
jgi:hypothetical protein